MHANSDGKACYYYRDVGSRQDNCGTKSGGSWFLLRDNLPPVLIPKFAELIEQSNGKIGKVALVIDLRGREFFTALSESLSYMKDHYTIGCEILFLDATDDVLFSAIRKAVAAIRWLRMACRWKVFAWNARCLRI